MTNENRKDTFRKVDDFLETFDPAAESVEDLENDEEEIANLKPEN